jgi:hypothetical protein
MSITWALRLELLNVPATIGGKKMWARSICGALLVGLAMVGVPSDGHADQLTYPRDGWDMFPGEVCGRESIEGGWFLYVDVPWDLPCQSCDATADPGFLALSPGRAVLPLAEGYAGVTLIEVDLVESDVALTATAWAGAWEVATPPASDTAENTGSTTLRLEIPGEELFSVVIECCDCAVEEVRFIGDRIVPVSASGWGVLKSKYGSP